MNHRHQPRAAGRKPFQILAAAIAILIVGLSSASAEPRITDVRMGEDLVQKADGYEIVRETTEFRPDSPKIVCILKVEGASVGMSFKGVWIAEDVGAAAPPNYKIMEKSLALPFLHN